MTKPCGSGDTVNGALQAARVHVLIRGDLLEERPVAATGAGLRPRSKGLDKPPDPTAALAARPGAIRDVIGQESAEAIVPPVHPSGSARCGPACAGHGRQARMPGWCGGQGSKPPGHPIRAANCIRFREVRESW